MKLFYLFILLSALSPFSADAQECILYGKITDGLTREALGGVYITVNKNKMTAVSQPDGKYILKLPQGKTFNISFSTLGYRTENVIKQISATDSIKCDIALFVSEKPIDEVVVTARSKARILRESSMPISVIAQHQLQGTASSINEVVARTTGVTVRNTGGVGSASRISVRGLEGKRMGLFIDESPMGQMSNFVSLNDIPTDMIERIEIYKGIVPYKFGGSALGGAVNIVTKDYPPFYFDT